MNIKRHYGFRQGTPNACELIEGDVFDALRTIENKSFDLIIVDPPYNVSKAGGRYGFKGKKFLNDTWDTIDDYAKFSKDWMDLSREVLKDNGTMYVWCYHRSIPYLPLSEWYPLNMVVWRKTNAFPTTMQNSIWSPSCEYAFFLRKNAGKDHTFHIGKDDFARDVFDLPVVTNKRHPSEKPLHIIKEFIRRSTNEGDLVLDLFSGSGTTLQACLELNRRCVSIELNAEYIDVILKRICGMETDVIEFCLPA